jgi:hypothetical protein
LCHIFHLILRGYRQFYHICQRFSFVFFIFDET